MRISNVILLVVVFGIGVTIGKLFDYGYFELSKEISIIEAISLFVTIGLAIFVTKKLENNRGEKDLYLKKIDELEDDLRQIRVIVNQANPSYQNIVSAIAGFNKQKNMLFKHGADYLNPILKESGLDKTINNAFFKLKKDATNSRAKGMSIKSDIITYDSNVSSKISSDLINLLGHLFELKLRINNR